MLGLGGSEPVNLSTDPNADDFLQWIEDDLWSPDGTRILLASDRSGSMELPTMSADGSDLVRLTNSPDSDDGMEAIWLSRN